MFKVLFLSLHREFIFNPQNPIIMKDIKKETERNIKRNKKLVIVAGAVSVISLIIAIVSLKLVLS